MKNLRGLFHDRRKDEISEVNSFTRRSFVITAAGTTLQFSMANKVAVLAGGSPLGEHDRAIHGIQVGLPKALPDNLGDTWITAWADDGNLYTPSNDSYGFHGLDLLTAEQIKLRCTDQTALSKQLTPEQKAQVEGHYCPIVFNRVEGNNPLDLHGVTVDRMQEYKEQEASNGKSAMVGRSWKSSGCAFIDGTLYWVIARHKYPEQDNVVGLRQNAVNASIIKSTDFGKNWTRSAQENLDSPMFPGSYFATPYFIDYGRDMVSVDGADRYVYAISNNGFWDNGDFLVLGRVSRTRLSLLNGADWELFTGGDGMIDANWTHDAGRAKPILEKHGHLGETGAVYLPARQRYMMIGWYYPGGSGYFKGSSKTTAWDFYESTKPWGPWTLIDSHTFSPQGYYCPSVCPKFQSANRIYVMTAGDFYNWWDYYHLTVVPIDLR
jgi:hypothetical protein